MYVCGELVFALACVFCVCVFVCFAFVCVLLVIWNSVAVCFEDAKEAWCCGRAGRLLCWGCSSNGRALA